LTPKNPSIILVRPQLPENIGMVARVMHNFGLKDLIVVSPRDKWLNNKSINAAKKQRKLLRILRFMMI
jgi:tRNA/rRNA methyltransferase